MAPLPQLLPQAEVDTTLLQQILSRDLQLLREAAFRDPDMQVSDQAECWKQTNDKIHLLNTIAALMTSGKCGDVAAAAFNLEHHHNHGALLVLVLAKNRTPNTNDLKAAQDLVTLLEDPFTHTAKDFARFLHTHCLKNIQKHVDKMRAATSSFDVESAFAQHRPLTIEEDFPKWKLKPSLRKETLEETFIHLFKKCNPEPISTKDPNPMVTFLELCGVVEILVRSHFLKMLCEDEDYPDQQRDAQRLKRRLWKLCQYNSGVNKLIQAAKNCFGNSNKRIPFRWVDDLDAFPSSRKKTKLTALSDYREMLCARLNYRLDNELADKWSELTENKRDTLRTRPHAELRLIIDLCKKSAPDSPDQKAIGVSKRSCFCCMLWIKGYNHLTSPGLQWITAGSHGKPYDTWALPLLPPSGNKHTEKLRDELNTLILDRVAEEVRQVVLHRLQGCWEVNTNESHSEEFVSSSCGSSDEAADPPQSRYYLCYYISAIVIKIPAAIIILVAILFPPVALGL